MMPALGTTPSTYAAKSRWETEQEIARRARSRAELFMLEDHKASLKSAEMSPARPGYLTHAENLGYGRGYRDAMIEVMSWVTGRNSDEILAELHDQVTEPAFITCAGMVPDPPKGFSKWADIKHKSSDAPGKPTPWDVGGEG